MENIFANSLSKVCKVFEKLIFNETNNATKKWAKDRNRHFPKDDIQIGNRHSKVVRVINHQGKTNKNYNEV